MHWPEGPEIPPVVRDAVERIALAHQAELNQFDSVCMQRLAVADASAFRPLLEQYCLERFDLCAAFCAPFAISQSPTAINPGYERYLRLFEKRSLNWLTQVLKHSRSDIREDMQTRVALKLSARILGLLAEAKAKHCARHPLPPIDMLVAAMNPAQSVRNVECEDAPTDGLDSGVAHPSAELMTVQQSEDLSAIPSSLEIVESKENRGNRRKAAILPILKQRRLTRNTWATRAGVNRGVVYDYLHGQSTPHEKNAVAMAEAIGLLILPE
jgi:hypothetical protein